MEIITKLPDWSGCVILTSTCNLKCKYCYVEQSNRTISKSLIDNFINGMRYNSMNKHISFFGGEPMLLQNLIFDIANENKDFTFSLTTNGTIPINEHLKWPKNIAQVTFSTEINETCYSMYRGDISYYNDITENINLVHSCLPKARLCINVSMNKYVIEHPEMLVDFYDKFKAYEILIFFTKGYIDYDKYQLYEFMLKLKKLNISLFKHLLMLDRDIDDNFHFSCTYDHKITLDCNGDIITCEKDGSIICNVDNYDEWCKVLVFTASNHRVFNDRCLNCVVPYSFCGVSCASDLNKDLVVDESCECQRLLWGLRMIERGELNHDES